MSEPTCYGCKYLVDTLGNYVECKKTAETGTHMFVDWYYWNDGSPDKCPLKSKEEDGGEKETLNNFYGGIVSALSGWLLGGDAAQRYRGKAVH